MPRTKATEPPPLGQIRPNPPYETVVPGARVTVRDRFAKGEVFDTGTVTRIRTGFDGRLESVLVRLDTTGRTLTFGPSGLEVWPA